jgi:hypothetical protein
LSRISWEHFQKLALRKETDKGTREEHGRGNPARIFKGRVHSPWARNLQAAFLCGGQRERGGRVLVMGGDGAIGERVQQRGAPSFRQLGRRSGGVPRRL